MFLYSERRREQRMKCCICGKEHSGSGNGCWPIKVGKRARCCNGCYHHVVIPTRKDTIKRIDYVKAKNALSNN